MKRTLCILLAFLTVVCGHSQEIEIKKVNNKTGFYQNDQLLNKAELNRLLKSEGSAKKQLTNSRVRKGFAILVAACGFSICANNLRDMDYGKAAVGIGVFVLAIPLRARARKSRMKAIDLYNSSLSLKSERIEEDYLGFSNRTLQLSWCVDF